MNSTDYVPTIAERIEICPRCKSHVLVTLTGYQALWCYRCGYKGRGFVYVRTEE